MSTLFYQRMPKLKERQLVTPKAMFGHQCSQFQEGGVRVLQQRQIAIL